MAVLNALRTAAGSVGRTRIVFVVAVSAAFGLFGPAFSLFTSPRVPGAWGRRG